MVLYGLKNCDTCRKALKVLGNIDFVDVRTAGVPDDILQTAFNTFGENLLNRRSTTWRGLPDVEREKPPLDLLRANPTLMKRPLIARDGQLWLGWGAEVQAALQPS